MRFLQLLAIAIIGYIAWKIVKLARAIRSDRDRDRAANSGVDFPPDTAYRNIEDADFEDITRDPDKSS